jgi:hypothetical protein
MGATLMFKRNHPSVGVMTVVHRVAVLWRCSSWSTASARLHYLRGLHPDDVNPQLLGFAPMPPSIGTELFRDCTVVDGTGWAPDYQSEVALELTDECAIGPEPWHGATIIIGPEVVTDLSIRGRSETSGTRIWGGGFGAVGAATGIAAATLINSLTQRTVEWTLVDLATCDGSVAIWIDQPVDRVRRGLRRFRDAIVAAQGDGDPKSGAETLTSYLERLASLRKDGMLDEVEFRAAKARILGTSALTD